MYGAGLNTRWSGLSAVYGYLQGFSTMLDLTGEKNFVRGICSDAVWEIELKFARHGCA